MSVISISDREGDTHEKLKELRKMGNTNNNPYHKRAIGFIALELINSEKSIDKATKDIQSKIQREIQK